MHRTPSFSSVSALLLAAAVVVGGPLACTASTTETPPAPPPIASPTTCSGDAIAQIGSRYALDSADTRAVWVDAQGVLLNLGDPTGTEGSVLASGTTTGGFSALLTLSSGSLVNAGANASDVYIANMGAGALPTMESVSRAGGKSAALDATDPSFVDLALGTSTVYEATLTGISSMPASGGAMSVIHSGGSALDLIVSDDGQTLYWLTGNTFGPYYVRTTSLTGPFTATTLATMPDDTIVSQMAVRNGQIVLVGTTYPLGDTSATTYSTSIYTVSAAGGTPVALDTVTTPGTAATPPAPRLALSSDAAYYSLDTGLKKLTLDGSNTVSAVAAPGSTLAGIGASASSTGAVYVVGECVYTAP